MMTWVQAATRNAEIDYSEARRYPKLSRVNVYSRNFFVNGKIFYVSDTHSMNLDTVNI